MQVCPQRGFSSATARPVGIKSRSITALWNITRGERWRRKSSIDGVARFGNQPTLFSADGQAIIDPQVTGNRFHGFLSQLLVVEAANIAV